MMLAKKCIAATALVLSLGAFAAGNTAVNARVINFNVQQDAPLSGDQTTLVGTIPAAKWTTVGKPSYGTATATTTSAYNPSALTDSTVSAVKMTAYCYQGSNWAYLGHKSGDTVPGAEYGYFKGFASNRDRACKNNAYIKLENIPFAQYDVYLYFAGARVDFGAGDTPAVSFTKETSYSVVALGATTITASTANKVVDANGALIEPSAATEWGDRSVLTPVLGKNVIKLTDQTASSLTLGYIAYASAVAAVQIVEVGAVTPIEAEKLEINFYTPANNRLGVEYILGERKWTNEVAMVSGENYWRNANATSVDGQNAGVLVYSTPSGKAHSLIAGGKGLNPNANLNTADQYWQVAIPLDIPIGYSYEIKKVLPEIITLTKACGTQNNPLYFSAKVEIITGATTNTTGRIGSSSAIHQQNVNTVTGAFADSLVLKGSNTLTIKMWHDAADEGSSGVYTGAVGVELYPPEPTPETLTLTHKFNFDGTMNAQVGGITIGNAASYVQGICDQAVNMGNNGDWYGTGMSAGTGNWSMMVVAKAPTTENEVLVALGGKSGDTGCFGVASAGNAGLKAFGWANDAATGSWTVEASEATSTYHFYVFTYDATNKKLKWSVDGGEYSAGVDFTYTSNSKWQIGGVHGGAVASTYCKTTSGAFDELRIYTGQLTTEDIAKIMAEFVWPYEATISGDTAFGAITGWTQNGAPVDPPSNIPASRLSLKGKGMVTGLAECPISLALAEGVACDVTAAQDASLSGYGQFLVRASSIKAARTFDAGLTWGLIGGETVNDKVTVSAALTVNCAPFVTYGHVKLENTTFASGNISGLYIYDVKAMTGNLSLGMATLSKREYQAMPGATITLDSASEVEIVDTYLLRDSGRAGGFYGQGTFAVAPNRTVYGGYLGIAAKPKYSGESHRRCQYVWADHGLVGRGATLKFTVMDTTLNTYLIDMLTRFTVDQGGKIELYKHGVNTAFATFTSAADGTRFSTEQLFGTPATTRDFETEGAQTMGYQGIYSNAVRVANFGYDTGFISALVDEARTEVTNAVPTAPYSVSLYADVGVGGGVGVGDSIITIGNPATRAIRLRVGEGMLQIVEVTGETVRETGIIAARGIGFHLFTITKTNKGVALYVDGQLVGTDFAITGVVSGPVTIGTGVSLRMFRIDEVQLSDALVAKLAAMWPINETTTPEVQSTDSILNQIRLSSEWAAEHLPESVVTNLYNHEAIKPDDEITGKAEERQRRLEEYQRELEKLGANGLPLWQSYLQGLDPDDPDKTHARPYVNAVRFEEDAVNYMATNTVVELSYANPERNSGINVTYHLAARDAAGNVQRNVPVLGTKAMIVDDSKPMNFTPKCEIQPKKPNIIFVLADDLGYGDVGWTVQNTRQANGQKYISTPHMDQMVREGCELTAHYAAAPVCAPSRASILTGKHQGLCSLRDNSFDCPILEERTIGTVMREQGYVTHAVGKWGVGGGGESGLPMIAHPLDRGFDHFYGFLDHGAGHTYYHYDGLLNGAYMGILEDRERKTETAVGLYSTDLLMARAKKIMIDQVAENKLTGTDKPVFMYLAINAMHGSGGDKLDASVPNKVNLHVPGRAFPDCTPGTPEKYGLNNGLDFDWLQANREPINDRNTWLYDYTKTSKYSGANARYATTITRLDEAMQDLKQTIIDLGIADNTIIVFTSDNGPTNEYGTNKDEFDSNGEFQQGKRSCMEGGLREPTFIWAPGYVKPGSVDNRPSMNHSWMQFFEEVAKSNTAPQLNDEVYCEYLYGNSQIMTRIGNYVGVNTSVGSCTLDTINLNIYDVVNDPGQTTNLANTPKGQELLPRMRELLKGYHHLWVRPGGYGNGDGGKQPVRPYDK